MGPKAHERLFTDCGTDNRPASLIEARARRTVALYDTGIVTLTVEYQDMIDAGGVARDWIGAVL